MEPRDCLVEQFSSFLFFSPDGQEWKQNPRLYQRMQKYLDQDPSLTSPEYWALYFWHQWNSKNRQNNYDKVHLYAYLQELCYSVAKRMHRTYQGLLCEYTIEDYFNEVILNVEPLLSNFNPRSNIHLACYVASLLKQRTLNNINKFVDPTIGKTIWSLLLRCTRKSIKQALIQNSISGNELEEYLLAWEHYQEIYPQDRKKVRGPLQEPNSEIWNKIAQSYNSESKSEPVDGEQISVWMTNAGNFLRNYLSRTKIEPKNSLDNPTGDEEWGQWQDVLEDPNVENPSEQLEDFDSAREIFELKSQIDRMILDLFAEEIPKIKPERQLELELRYGQRMKWEEISAKIGETDHTLVLKRVQTVRKKLAGIAIERSRSRLSIPLQPDNIKVISNALEFWLEQYYQTTYRQQILDLLAKEIPKIESRIRLVLQFCYTQGMNWQEIATHLFPICKI